MQVSRFGAATLAVLLVCFAAGPGLPQDVTLTSRDGSLRLDGTLAGFDGEFYRIDTVYGPLTVDGLGVTCAGPGCPDLEAYVAEATFAGSEILADVLIPALIESFAATRDLPVRREYGPVRDLRLVLTDSDGRDIARFAMRPSTTDDGLSDLLAGRADVALSAREVTAAEVQAARAAGLGTLSAPGQSRVVALDALVAVVSPDNPALALTPEMLALAMAGEITDWGMLGGQPGLPVRVHALAPGLGAQQAMVARLMVPMGRAVPPAATLHDDPRGMADAVRRDPGAIGVTLASGLGNARALPLTGACGFLLRPTEAATRSEDYPLAAPLFLYTPARRLPAILRDFLAYLTSPAAERVIRRAGFVDRGIRSVPLSAQGDRLANAVRAAGGDTPLAALQDMVRALDGAERLSPTFRFRTGAAGLDASSRASVLGLAEAMEAGVFDGRTLIFAGFSDGDGGADANLRIARNRAETVLAAVRALAETADGITLQAAAFGEALPMACDDSDWGRHVNRRVEVWLR